MTFSEKLCSINSDLTRFKKLETLQVNLGNRCNLNCSHCHLEAGSSGDKMMGDDILEKILNYIKRSPGLVLDITGGCPELHPGLKSLVEGAKDHVSKLMIRTNLAILDEAENAWIPSWYMKMGVVLIGSLPCYTEENVDSQRGTDTFKKSIAALKKLNSLGYGDELELDLVYNPGGAFLPGDQQSLERDYKKELFEKHRVHFSNLFTITNAPLGRFKKKLLNEGKLEEYNTLLAENFNPEAAGNIMCRNLINIDWRGVLYNCDFNQASGLPIRDSSGKILTIDDLQYVSDKDLEIVTEDYCYSCTAGAGSSCTGSLA